MVLLDLDYTDDEAAIVIQALARYSDFEFKLDEQGQGAWAGGNEMEVGPW